MLSIIAFYFDMTNLNNLTEKEKQVTLQILQELSKGSTDSYEQLLYADYSEIPVDIETFVNDDTYLGLA